MIRSDIYGFVAPTSARQAAWLAFKDASVSHTANGIYASMWAAALVWEAINTGDAALAVRRSSAHVPTTSRLHAALTEVIDLHAEGSGWTATLAAIQARWGHLAGSTRSITQQSRRQRSSMETATSPVRWAWPWGLAGTPTPRVRPSGRSRAQLMVSQASRRTGRRL